VAPGIAVSQTSSERPATAASAPAEPHLTFTDGAWRRLALYATLCPFEIGGLGVVRPVGPDYEIVEVHLLQQDVNDISTRLDGDAVSALMVAMIEHGEDPATLRLWWHSHAREKTFWSGEDEETIAGFRNDAMLSLVVNHELRALARLDTYAPRRTDWVWIDRPEAALAATSMEIDAVRAEIADAVRYVPQRRREQII